VIRSVSCILSLVTSSRSDALVLLSDLVLIGHGDVFPRQFSEELLQCEERSDVGSDGNRHDQDDENMNEFFTREGSEMLKQNHCLPSTVHTGRESR